MSKIIAVDFDGTLCETAPFPGIGLPRESVIRELLRQQKEEGARLILWTNREGVALEMATTWCLNNGIKFDAVNDNIDEMKEFFGNNPRKIFANEYWDDRAVRIDETSFI